MKDSKDDSDVVPEAILYFYPVDPPQIRKQVVIFLMFKTLIFQNLENSRLWRDSRYCTILPTRSFSINTTNITLSKNICCS